MAGFSSGTLSPSNVDLDSSQTLENKTLDASNDFSGDIIDPSRSDVKQDTQANLETYASGAANGQMCFATDTKQMYQVLDSALAAVGGGSGSLDTFLTDTFEVAGVSEYTSGNNAAFDNGGTLVGTLADDTTTNISGTQSLKYTQASGSLNDFIKSPLIPISKKQQGQTVGLELYYTYSGPSDDIKIVGYDDTGSEVMTLSSNLIKSSSKAQRLSVQFPVPSDSVNLAYGVQVVSETIGAILVIDDVQMSTNPYVSKDLLVSETAVGSYQGSFWDGTGTQDGFNIALVDNSDNSLFSIITSGSTSRITAKRKINIAVGFITQSNTAGATNVYHSTLGQIANQQNNAAITAFTTNVNTILEEGEYVYAVALNLQSTVGGISITATAATNHIIAYNSRNAENSMIRYSGQPTKSTNMIDFGSPEESLGNSISTADNIAFVVEESGHYSVNTTLVISGLGNEVCITKNYTDRVVTNAGVLAWAYTQNASDYNSTVSWAGQLSKGDIIRVTTGGTLSTSTANKFTISKIGVGDLLGVPVSRTAYIKDVKASGTSGGTFTSGAWQTRTINTLSGDTEFISIGTGTTGTDGTATRFTLEPGKYEIEAQSVGYAVNSHQAKLYNITDSNDSIIGTGEQSRTTDAHGTWSKIEGTLIITNSKTFEIQHRCSTTNGATSGRGAAVNFSINEVYTICKIRKIS